MFATDPTLVVELATVPIATTSSVEMETDVPTFLSAISEVVIIFLSLRFQACCRITDQDLKGCLAICNLKSISYAQTLPHEYVIATVCMK